MVLGLRFGSVWEMQVKKHWDTEDRRSWSEQPLRNPAQPQAAYTLSSDKLTCFCYDQCSMTVSICKYNYLIFFIFIFCVNNLSYIAVVTRPLIGFQFWVSISFYYWWVYYNKTDTIWFACYLITIYPSRKHLFRFVYHTYHIILG